MPVERDTPPTFSGRVGRPVLKLWPRTPSARFSHKQQRHPPPWPTQHLRPGRSFLCFHLQLRHASPSPGKRPRRRASALHTLLITPTTFSFSSHLTTEIKPLFRELWEGVGEGHALPGGIHKTLQLEGPLMPLRLPPLCHSLQPRGILLASWSPDLGGNLLL